MFGMLMTACENQRSPCFKKPISGSLTIPDLVTRTCIRPSERCARSMICFSTWPWSVVSNDTGRVRSITYTKKTIVSKNPWLLRGIPLSVTAAHVNESQRIRVALARKLRECVGGVERILIADHTNLIPIVLLQFAGCHSNKPAQLVGSWSSRLDIPYASICSGDLILDILRVVFEV